MRSCRSELPISAATPGPTEHVPRLLQPLAVPAGRRVLDLLPVLAAALAGDGPALLPVPAADPAETARLVNAFDAGTPLEAGEDDQADPTAVVVGTSGSTGEAKGALLPVGALRHSARATTARLGTPAAHWLLALAGHHIAGLQVLLRALSAGTEPTVLDTASPFTADRFTRAVAAMPSGPRCVSLVPTQLVRILADPEATAAATTFDAVLLGGAATTPELLQRALSAGIRAVTTYGMSETCGGCVYDGLPLDGVNAELEDGRVVLTGPVVARGYRGRPGDPAFGPGRRFRTADRAEFRSGRLQILGRTDDLIVTGGLKVDPVPVERAIRTLPGVSDVLVVGVPDPQWGQAVVAVIAAGDDPPTLAELAAVTSPLGPAAVPKRALAVAALPMRGIGKPDRRAAVALATELSR